MEKVTNYTRGTYVQWIIIIPLAPKGHTGGRLRYGWLPNFNLDFAGPTYCAGLGVDVLEVPPCGQARRRF